MSRMLVKWWKEAGINVISIYFLHRAGRYDHHYLSIRCHVQNTASRFSIPKRIMGNTPFIRQIVYS